MNNTAKSIFFKLGILLLLFAIAAIYNYFTEPARQLIKSANLPDIDYYATNIDMVQYTPEGNTEYKMTAKEMSHEQKSDIAYLVDPTANLYKQSKNPWFIRSNSGEIGPKGETVKLINDIKGMQVDERGKTNSFEIGKVKADHNPTNAVKYGELMIYPKQKYADSKDYVYLSSDDGNTSGTGMKAYLNTNKIKLLSNVKTYIKEGKHAAN